MIDIFNSNIVKVLTIFSISPGSRLNRKNIKEKTNIPNIVLDKILYTLINLNVLIKEKNIFSINHKNREINEILKFLYEKYSTFKQLQLKEYFLILNIKDAFLAVREIRDVYLFGSYAKLIFTTSSDIDIAIVSKQINKREVEKVIRKIEKKYKKKIEIHYFTKDFYKHKRDPLVKEILQHGIKMI
ncbi:nucleotidyltransferase domain-containing protein [Candidatus Pacearchaeota archaeon]|nr:nucleotidyltransferase domain-containing protein [Candidatus Pacearchaeota archaeon]